MSSGTEDSELPGLKTGGGEAKLAMSWRKGRRPALRGNDPRDRPRWCCTRVDRRGPESYRRGCAYLEEMDLAGVVWRETAEGVGREALQVGTGVRLPIRDRVSARP